MSEETAISNKLISFNLFDKKNIRKIKIDFKRKEEGLEKEHFISIMLHHLEKQARDPTSEPEEPFEELKREERFSRVLELERTARTEKISLVAALNDLFSEIDVNDDKHLE